LTPYVPATFVAGAGGPALIEVQLTERFTGDIVGEGVGRAIQALRGDGSATFVAIERVRGAIDRRRGTFVLQVKGTIVRKEMRAEWFVVPGSGTGALVGLRGEGGFEAQLGQHGSVWLDYSFN
jgi:hypothetical protein